jgi:hypothetical protein
MRMEYAFSAGSGELVIDVREHDGGHLDWYSFVRRAPAARRLRRWGRPPPAAPKLRGWPRRSRLSVFSDAATFPT